MMKKKVLVIGLGRFGSSLVQELWENGAETIVVDREAAGVEDVKEWSHAAFVADGTDPELLENIGAREVDAAVVTFGENFEGTVLTVATLKKFEVKEIVARAATDRRASILRAVGATRVIQLEREMGRRLGGELTTRVAHDLIEFAAHYRVVPWTASGAVVGKSLRELTLRERYSVNVLGIRAADAPAQRKLAPPRPDHVVRAGDVLLLVGDEDDVQRLLDAAEG